MNIIWQYLDKKSAAVNALKDYSSMQFIISHTSDEIKEVYDDMSSVGSPKFDGMPKAHNSHAHEEKMTKCIEDIDVLKERYRQAVEYMQWFKPAWGQLSDDEQYILETFYNCDDSQTRAVYKICDKYHIERSSAYNKKNRAVAHLAALLFGKG